MLRGNICKKDTNLTGEIQPILFGKNNVKYVQCEEPQISGILKYKLLKYWHTKLLHEKIVAWTVSASSSCPEKVLRKGLSR